MKCTSLITMSLAIALSSSTFAADLKISPQNQEYALIATAPNLFNWTDFDGSQKRLPKYKNMVAAKSAQKISKEPVKAPTLPEPKAVLVKPVQIAAIQLTDPGEIACNAKIACETPVSVVATLHVRSGFKIGK